MIKIDYRDSRPFGHPSNDPKLTAFQAVVFLSVNNIGQTILLWATKGLVDVSINGVNIHPQYLCEETLHFMKGFKNA